MALPTNTTIHLPFLAATSGGYNQFVHGIDVTAIVPGLPPAASVAGVRDLNGDLVPETIIGIPGDDETNLNAGRVYVTFGYSATVPNALLTSDPTRVITIDGASAGDLAGFAVGSIADLNGDGLAEILVGAPMMENGALADAGGAFVVWGQNAASDVALSDPVAGLGDGFAMLGQAAQDHVGTALTAVGDLNGDGRAEILVSATGNDAGGAEAGAAYLVWGTSAETPIRLANVAAGSGGFRIIGQAAGDGASRALGTVADLNGDGRAELLIGAPGNDAGGANAGAVYVVFGKATGTEVNLDAVAAGAGGFRITGAAGENAGMSVTGVGDVNGDGRADILLTAPGSGKAYVVFGKGTNTNVNLATLASSGQGFVIRPAAAGDLEGMNVAAGGDFNRDGIADYLIGAPKNDTGATDLGAVYVVWGGNHSTVDLSLVAAGIGGVMIDGAPSLPGSAVGSGIGTSVATLPDMNRDGTPDILISSPLSATAQVTVLFSPASWRPETNVYGSNDNDIIGLGDGTARLIGNGNDEVYGFAGNDTITTAGGDDILNGGSGADTLIGGLGNDSYVVDNTADRVTEGLGAGIDSVFASASWTMDANVENLTLSGGAAINGTGNALDNRMVGNGANNRLDGGAGNDSMNGGAGNDVFRVGLAAGVDVFNGGAGSDRIVAVANSAVIGMASFSLAANSIETIDATGFTNVIIRGTTGNDVMDFSGMTLTNILRIDGDSGNDIITGTAGNDTISGVTGNDTMNGGLGNDTFRVSLSAGTDVFNGGGGSDSIVAVAANAVIGMASFGAANSIETITANGITGVQIRGTTLADNLNFSATTLIGITSINADAGNDTVVGSAAANTVGGGAGKDTMTGGLGNDIFDFNLTSDSGVGSLLRDIITDFAPGIDDIDLRTIDPGAAAGDQAFAFMGSAAFSNTLGATGVRAVTGTGTLAGYTQILIDTDDADTVANMEILLAGTPTVTAGDFML